MKTDNIAYLSAAKAIILFKKGTLSPVELLQAQINRTSNLNSGVNCITYKHFDQAMGDAEESQKRYKNGNPRELEGITVAIKDKYGREGWITTKGSSILKDNKPAEENDALVDMLLEAGAVLHIQTTAPEFYLSGTTWSRLWGVTRNPWNLAYSPGGSSGGAGAALSAGFTTLAIGSDMGGSIRIPCSFCGLYGYKPPFGRVPTSETAYESAGPMARTFKDMVLLQRVITGPHLKVHSSIRPKLNYPMEYRNVKDWKVAVDFAGGIDPLDASVKKPMDQAVQNLQNIGCNVQEVDLGFTYDKFSIWVKGLFSTAKGTYLLEASRHKELITPYVARLVDKYSKVGPEEAAKAEALLTLYHRRVQDKIFNNGFNALIMPTLMTPYIFADYGRTTERDYFLVNGEKTHKSIFAFTWPWNLMGKYPVVNVPVGMGPNGVPIGMQIISNTFDDLTAFQLAAAYSKVAPDFFKKKFPDFRLEE